MKALVFHGPRDIRYDEHPDPRLRFDHSVVIRVQLSSICGSDLHLYHGDRIGKTDYSAGVERFCVGHEFLGEVVETGPAVHLFSVGDRVLAGGGTGCGRCAACLSRTGRCPVATAFGLSRDLEGGQAEYAEIPNADLSALRVPDGVSDEQAILLTDALATAHFGVGRADIAPGDVVVVSGLGPIGLLGVELAFLRGASLVVAVDPVASRRQHASGLGAVVAAPGDEAKALVREVTAGRGADRVFEASGARASVTAVPGLLGWGGTASFIGLPQGDTALPLRQLMYKNQTMRAGIANVTAAWPQVVPLLQTGRLRGEGLFSHRLPLSDGAEGYRLFDAREEGTSKILFEVT